MGLTIHYSLATTITKVEDIRTLVKSLQQSARDLPFKEVDDVVEFQGEEADFSNFSTDDPKRWLKVQAGQYVSDPGNKERSYSVNPLHIVAFSTWPGEGCEEANFGLCRYPATIDSRGRRIKTGLTGWRWRSFCKTQYASDPQCGGVANFLRCHLCVIRFLDLVRSSGLVKVEVSDEGNYWEHRDLKKLGSEVGEWNEMIAAVSGILKDDATAHGISLESAIAAFPNFEHLEAKGRERLQSLRERHSQG
ncbi:MAG: hypothetical protein FJ271_24945 [Planctomycetes bacterium]|nr:hypothetical protein [Planctomycetota bacterium]